MAEGEYMVHVAPRCSLAREEGRSLSLVRWAVARDALVIRLERFGASASSHYARTLVHEFARSVRDYISKSARAIASCVVLEQYELRVTSGVMDDRRSATCILRVNIAKAQQVLSLRPCLNYMSTQYETRL